MTLIIPSSTISKSISKTLNSLCLIMLIINKKILMNKITNKIFTNNNISTTIYTILNFNIINLLDFHLNPQDSLIKTLVFLIKTQDFLLKIHNLIWVYLLNKLLSLWIMPIQILPVKDFNSPFLYHPPKSHLQINNQREKFFMIRRQCRQFLFR